MNPSAKTSPGVHRYLVLGDASFQYPVSRESIPFIIAELPGETGDANRAVEYLPSSATATTHVVGVSQRGDVVADETLEKPIEVWNGCYMTPQFSDWLTGRPWARGPVCSIRIAAPLMVLRCHDSGEVETLMATRLRSIGAVFARVARHRGQTGSLGRLLFQALEESSAYHENVGTEWQEFTKFDRGTEIETKINLDGPVSVWGLASYLASRVGTDAIPGFVPDVGNEMQRWNYVQRTCEVLAPNDRVGYIALSKSPAGTFVKVKEFATDTLRRKETGRRLETPPDVGFMEFVAAEYPELEVRELPMMKRTRFDVNLESVATGHFYGIEVDEVAEIEGGRVLRQLEIEYHRSRVHDGLDKSTVEPELHRITELVESQLERLEVVGQRTFYSKLSFLRDCLEGAGSESAAAT